VPAPGLRDIRWNNLGVFIYVIFDAPTDMGAAAMGSLRRGVPNRPDNFDCNLLLQFTSFTVYQLGLGTHALACRHAGQLLISTNFVLPSLSLSP
jgi:hypothetical protein